MNTTFPGGLGCLFKKQLNIYRVTIVTFTTVNQSREGR